MQLLPGTIIKSTDDLNNTAFENTIILITEANIHGAVGFVLNKPLHRKLNELAEFTTSPAFPLYAGGPVDQEHLFFIHRRPDIIPEGTAIINDIYMGGDFKAAIAYLKTNIVTAKNLRLFIGYCGWDAGELEAEIDEGSWKAMKDDSEGNNRLIFNLS